MRSWYKLECERQNKPTCGVSGFSPEQIMELLCNFTSGKMREGNIDNREVFDILRRAIEDLKTCYMEAISNQPAISMDEGRLADYFWGQTHAALVIDEVRKSCMQHPREDIRILGISHLVPFDQKHRFNG